MRNSYFSIFFLICLIQNSQALTVGSKVFTEGVIIGEIVSQYLSAKGIETEHKKNLGGTRILWDALLAGDIDIYPEYTGTLIHEIFSSRDIHDLTELEAVLQEYNLSMTSSLGFNNTYVMGMLNDQAGQLQINSITDLARHQELIFGLSNEFLARGDGWQQLKEHYGLPHENIRGIDHDLAYRGLENGDLDVMDLYSTDAEIEYYSIRTLVDDRVFFPEYLAVIIYRNDILDSITEGKALFSGLEDTISEELMISMNADVKLHGLNDDIVASNFLNQQLGITFENKKPSQDNSFIKNTIDHLTLVLISLAAAIIVSIPLGIISAKMHKLGQVIIGIAGIFQTIPALALLVFMIPLFGIGGVPAIVALFLYSLLPIIRNTASGIKDIPTPVLESAIALGLSDIARLRIIELPLAMRSIITGIKISAIINIGTATLGALIGAGGYGQPIITGIRLNDMGLILQGAVPAAVLAILLQLAFELLEKRFVPRGL